MRRVIYLCIAVASLMCGAALGQADSGENDAASEAELAARGEAELSRAERRALRQAEREAELTAGAAAEEDEEDDEGLICRRESVVGTHRRVRICTTREQREAMRESSREVIRDIARNRGVLGPEGQ